MTVAAENLPAMIDRAASRLSDARTSGEILEAHQIAQAALHYAKVTNAANKTHADCLRIIVRAEMLMADAVDEGQAAGDIRTKAHNQHVRTSDKLASLDEIGVARQRLAEWRVLRDAGIEAVDAAIDAQFAEGKVPTKSGIQAALAGYTGNFEWYTPAEWVERAREVLGVIDCDPATHPFAQRTVKATCWFDKARDGLRQQWIGNVWLNPPYARGLIESFVKKLGEETQIRQAIVLTDNRTDTRWFHDLCGLAAAVAFPRGRINFYSENGPSSSPASGSSFFYLGNSQAKFTTVFGQCCAVLEPKR
jgi:hypothetical protein